MSKKYVCFSQRMMMIKGMKDFLWKEKIRKRIKSSGLIEEEKKQLYYLSKYGIKYEEYISEYLDCSLRILSGNLKDMEKDSPILLCVVKDDLFRLSTFFEYYRKIGIKQFVFLDDKSSDGTREFLMFQDDVLLFGTEKNYSTIRRQVWINKMISTIGYNRWYLVLDSDEIFDYPYRDKKSITEYVDFLEEKGKTRVKAILLDMFSKNQLFDDSIIEPQDIFEKCCFYLPEYKLEQCHYDVRIVGGARGEMFSQIGMKETPIVSKYPLIFIREDDIVINSHCNLPATRNYPDKPETILRHYKFLPGDKEKYIQRVTKGNFENGSQEYKAYLRLEGGIQYKTVVDKMIRYNDYNSAKEIEIFKREG